MASRQCRISQGVGDAPPPPLAGSLAAWLARDGWQVRIVDPRRGPSGWEGEGPLWVHLDRGFVQERLDELPGKSDLRLFGPALSDDAVHAALTQRFPQAQLLPGDPEPSEGRMDDLGELPLCTYAGFGDQSGGLFRILAGRGDRQRPVAHLCREIVYLVETFAAGHLLFDDEDLGAYPGWLQSFRAELAAMPWALTWEGTLAGERIRAQGRRRTG
jgi:hypothetical protein